VRVGDLDVVGLETVPQGQQHLAADSAGSGVALTPASYPELDWEDAAKIAAAAAALPPAYLEVVNKQAAEIPDLISQVEAALEAGNAREAERAAHSLKSYSASFGARSLWSLAQEAEARAKAGDLAAVSGMMEAMHAAHGQARHSASAAGLASFGHQLRTQAQ
jgi:HPt (histidine-containing phosphotransfer) domain-containing protein